jgi:outer membrane protein assembly factor BamA
LATWSRRPVSLLLAILVAGNPILLAGNPLQAAQPGEVVSEVQIRGNVATPDEEVLRLAGVAIGMPVTSDTVTLVADRLRATKRFERVDVLKRYASISDPTRIALVVMVDEGPVTLQATGDPDRPIRVVRSRRLNLLFLPMLDGEDGYGVTYGARLAVPNPAGADSRLSFPLTWGGEKRAAAELEKRFDDGLVTRVDGGVSVSRKTNPFFQQDDDRAGVWARGERQVLPALRIGATLRWQRDSFQGVTDRLFDVGAEVVVDTRLDPWLARNAVYVRVAEHRFEFRNEDAADRNDLDTHLYVGLFRQTILVASVQRSAADSPLPNYLKAILGGQESVRGFKAGTAVGDTLVAGSLEVRVPLTSALRLGKFGVSGFTDAGTVYDHGARFDDSTIRQGFGASVWCAAAFLRVNVAVAHGIGASTRVHASGNITF